MVQTYPALSVGKNKNKSDLFDTKHALVNNLEVSVIVPVRNEAVHLTFALDALRKQEDIIGKPLKPGIYEVLVLLNNCTDHSADIVYKYQKKYPDLPLHIENIQLPAAMANIGVVRRMLMDAAYRRLIESGSPNGIIASTDGDTVVDRNWMCQIIKEIANGNDAVGVAYLPK